MYSPGTYIYTVGALFQFIIFPLQYLKENDYKDWTPLESQQVEFEDTGLIGVDLEQGISLQYCTLCE